MILGDGPELRDYVTEMGIVEPLLRLIKTDTPVSNFVTDKTSEVLQVEHLTSYKKNVCLLPIYNYNYPCLKIWIKLV